MTKDRIFISAATFILLLVSACSSSKKAGERSYFGRVYHNTTARYNGYYYARLRMNEFEKAARNSLQNDYSKILPLYELSNETTTAGSEMDSVIKRLTVVTKLHPDTKWEDDCYYYIGKSYYYKKEHESALAAFQHVSAITREEAKKKKGGKTMSAAEKAEWQVKQAKRQVHPILSKFRHREIRNEDLIWLVRSLADMKKYGEAQAIISLLDESVAFPKSLRDDLLLVQTYVFLSQNQTESAIQALQQTIEQTKNKKYKTRLTYILAQLYQSIGNQALASAAYQEVSRLKPDYEMDFNAKINVAKNYSVSGTTSAEKIISQLKQMARDDKYEEFYDQIYYAIAEIHLRSGQQEEAIENLETSIQKSISNNHQKGLSFLRLGELFFENRDYLTAQPAYDSAKIFLDADFSSIAQVKKRSEVLNAVARQHRLIYEQDSLQKLASLSEKERDKVLEDFLFKLEKQRQKEDSLTNFLSLTEEEEESNSNQLSGGWYFYNATAKSAGFNDFQNKWGKRKLEDNWRRSNKSTSGLSEPTVITNPEVEENSPGKTSGSLTKDDLLAGIPLTPQKLEASNVKLADAYYTLGILYKNDVPDGQRAIEIFEKSIQRFPQQGNAAAVYYNLYLVYRQMQQNEKANSCREIILNRFPTSTFAAVISDPDYAAKQEVKANELKLYYASTYQYYEQENYGEVIKRIRRADSIYKANPLQPKFDLLHAFAVGKTQGRDQFIAALDTVVIRHREGEEHDKAIEILTALGARQNPIKKNDLKTIDENVGKGTYTYKPDNPHYFIVWFSNVNPKAKALQDSIDNYNRENHILSNLKTTVQLLDTKQQMVLVKQFKSAALASDYYNEILEWQSIWDGLENLNYEVFLIDDKSYITFYQRKNVAEYLDFFEENY